MAENKRSFVLYCDLIHTVRKMPKDKAGELFLTILGYVNDENPEITDQVVDLVFEPVRQQLKRDLKKWERYISKQSRNGKMGGRPTLKPKKPKPFLENPKKPSQPKKADSVSVSVNVSDSVSVNGNAAAAATPELGIEIVKQVSNEVWKDQGRKEALCMGLGITIAELKKWMALFNSSISNDRIEGVFDKPRYLKMCQGWILLQQSKGVKVETGLQKQSSAPPLNH